MNIFKLKTVVRKSIPLLIALVTFASLIIGSISFSNYKKDLWEKDVKTRLFELLMTRTTKLEIALYSRIHYTKSVAAYVSLKPEITAAEFHNLAKELIRDDSVISTMALSKDCILGAIYPEKGHEAAIGLNLLDHPERRDIVEQTIETHNTFIAGPVELVEGGIAFISYTPIFDKSKGEIDKFWGVTDIVIYQDMLIKEASLKENESGFLFAIRGQNGLGKNGKVWWGDKKVFEQNPITNEIKLPTGSWEIAAIPEKGWPTYLELDKVLLILLLVSSFIISILIWLIGRAVAKIRRNEQELNAIFRSMNSLIIEFNQEGRYIKIPPLNKYLLVRPREELINKTIFDILPEDLAKKTHNAIIDCLKTKKLVEFEYNLQIENKTIWFAARLSWKSENSVIFHAFDITEQKSAREEIIINSEKLKALNATKDKFFSIIAHDLKSPFSSILGFSDLIVEKVKEEDYEGVEKYADIIQQSSNRAMDLLMNLMEWSQSQSGRMEYNPEYFELVNLIKDTELILSGALEQKSLSLSKILPSNAPVFADKKMISTVLRNLISNAIKFTNQGGKISISLEEKIYEIIVAVSDTGVGISKANSEKLFKIEHSYSTPGTKNEEGTGLGLILCKEFVEKQGGKIWVESEEAKGSTVYFTIPNKA